MNAIVKWTLLFTVSFVFGTLMGNILVHFMGKPKSEPSFQEGAVRCLDRCSGTLATMISYGDDGCTCYWSVGGQ
jgi:hypothetical protein